MQPFDFQLKTRLIFGNDSIDRLGELANELSVKRVLVVSDPGIVRAGHVGRGIESLQRAKLETALFDGAHENPTTDDIENGLAVAKDFQPDLIVGLGGGSSLDCAKGINFVYSGGGTMHDYHGVGKASAPMLPMIAVPTTSGTGSEMQSFALISDAKTKVKMACGDKKATCRVAILDPRLTLTQPALVTALTGIDAISHALETFVTKPRNPISMLYSRESWRLLSQNFARVVADPNDIEARAAMQLGAAYAGVAIENSMLGAAHALANPLTAAYEIAHGQAVGLMLPHVIRFNGQQHNDWYCELLSYSQLPDVGSNSRGNGQVESATLADWVEQTVAAAGLKITLNEMAVSESRLPELAVAAAAQWTGTFNPRPVDADSLLTIYRDALGDS